MAIKIQGSTIIDDSRKVINASHVGIGTTNPTVELDVDGNANISGIVTAAKYVVGGGSSTGFLKADGSIDNSPYATGTGTLDSIVIKDDGQNVGSASTFTSLDFYNGIGVSTTGNVGVASVRLEDNISISGIFTAGEFKEYYNGQYWNVVTQADVGYGASQVPLNQHLGQLAFLDDHHPNGLRRDGASSDDVSVNSSGYVGIGSAQPIVKLDVDGDARITGIVTAATFSGSGSGLTNLSASSIVGIVTDSNLLDGIDSAFFLRSDVAGTKSSGDLTFNDNIKLNLGSGGDLELYHNGSNSYIKNATGSLHIENQSDDGSIFIKTDDGSGGDTNYIQCNGLTGEVSLFHYGNEKLNTRSAGIDVTGNAYFGDNGRVILGAGNDFQFYHTGTHSTINNGVGDINIENSTDDGSVIIRTDNGSGGKAEYIDCDGSVGEVKLYHYGTQKLATKSNGIDVTGHTETDTLNVSGVSTFQSNIHLGDNDKINLGDDDDLEIYHNGNYSYIKDTGTGGLVVNTDALYVKNAADDEAIAYFVQDSSVSLYFDNSKKFETTGIGVSIVGTGNTATITGPSNLVLDPAAVGDATGTVTILGNLQVDGTQTIINSTTLEVDDKLVSIAKSATNATQANGAGLEINGASATLTYDSTGDKWVANKSIEATSFIKNGGASTEFLKADGSVDSSTYITSADGGDAATLDGIDSTSFLRSDVNSIKSAGYLRLNDGVQLTFGTGADMEIFHNGVNGYVRNGVTGNLYLANTFNDGDVIIQSDNGSGGNANYFLADGSSGEAILYHYGTQKLATKSNGIDVTGHTETDTLNVSGVTTSSSFVKASNSGGFLKADGTEDTNTYLTSYTETQTLDNVVGLGSTTTQTITVGTATTGVVIRPDGTLNVTGIATVNSLNAISITLKDNRYLYFGNSSQGSIVYNAANFELATSSGDLNLKGSGSVALFEGNNKKLETTANGIAVSGIVTASSGIVTYYGDGSQLTGISAGSPSPWITTGYTGIGTTSAVGIGTIIEVIPYDTQNNGTLSFEASAGQLFSITNNLTTGSIFSVNDVSGIPSIDVDADGTIQLAPFGSTEFVGIGTTNPTAKLDVNGTVALGSSVYDANGTFGTNGQVLSNVTGFGVSWTNAAVGGGSVAGSDGQIQYNNGGSFGGAAQLYYDDTNNRVGINSSTPTSTLDVNGTLGVSGISTFTSSVKIIPSLSNQVPLRFDTRLTPTFIPQISFILSNTGRYQIHSYYNNTDGYAYHELASNSNFEIGLDGGSFIVGNSNFPVTTKAFEVKNDAETYLTYNKNKKLETTNTGISITGNVEKYDTLVGSGSTTVVQFAVTVAAKSDHRYSGGSTSAYYLDGIESPFLTFTPGRTYRFNQSDSSNGSHPLRFYLDAAKTTEYTYGVTISGTHGTANAYVEIDVTDETPTILHYQCGAHAYMGNAIQTNGSTIVNGRYDVSPNNTVPVHSLSAIGTETNIDVALVPKGTGAVLASVPDGASTGGNKRGENAVDLQTARASATKVASGNQSAILGGSNNEASGSLSVVINGQNNTSSSFAGICGGSDSSATGDYYAIALGYVHTANSSYSCVLGGSFGTARGIEGNFVTASHAGSGYGQKAHLIVSAQTTNATQTNLTVNGAVGVSTTNQVTLANNAAYAFKGTCVAGVTGAGNTKAWEFRGAIKRGANAASTTLVGSVIKDVLAYDAGAAAWDVDFTADTTNGALQVKVTGQASTTIRWVCKIETTEMAF